MLRRAFTAAAVLLALGATLPAAAQPRNQGDVVVSYHLMLQMADRNGDGMVSKQEFMAAMSSLYDMQMKKMQGDAMMVKGEMLSADAVRRLFKELYPGN